MNTKLAKQLKRIAGEVTRSCKNDSAETVAWQTIHSVAVMIDGLDNSQLGPLDICVSSTKEPLTGLAMVHEQLGDGS